MALSPVTTSGTTRRYHRLMAYDEALAARIRDCIGAAPDLTEKKMFGGLAFLIGGHNAVAGGGPGGLQGRGRPGGAGGAGSAAPPPPPGVGRGEEPGPRPGPARRRA